MKRSGGVQPFKKERALSGTARAGDRRVQAGRLQGGESEQSSPGLRNRRPQRTVSRVRFPARRRCGGEKERDPNLTVGKILYLTPIFSLALELLSAFTNRYETQNTERAPGSPVLQAVGVPAHSTGASLPRARRISHQTAKPHALSPAAGGLPALYQLAPRRGCRCRPERSRLPPSERANVQPIFRSRSRISRRRTASATAPSLTSQSTQSHTSFTA